MGIVEATDNSRFDSVIAELRCQGLRVSIHNPSNQTWYIADEGVYVGYVATGDELVELKRINRLNLNGIRSLG